jgi:dipeptide/tripeptide permease
MASRRENEETKAKFPPVFWFANARELFERSAYYSMATFVVIYLGQMGLGTYWPAMLNTLLWFLVYFLPILSGTVADQIGYRRALLGACLLLTAGYLLLGSPVWVGAASLSPTIEREVTAGAGAVVPAVIGIVLVGFGGSIVKPCVLATTQKTAGSRATLAFALFYLVVNIGALFGRVVAYYVRTRPGAALTSIFAVAAALALLAPFVEAVRNRTETPIDVYDSAVMSVIIPLSGESIRKGGAPAACPDFTRGKWRHQKPAFGLET